MNYHSIILRLNFSRKPIKCLLRAFTHQEEDLGEETMEEFLSTYYDRDNEDIREHYDDIDSEGYVGTIKYSRTKSILLELFVVSVLRLRV